MSLEKYIGGAFAKDDSSSFLLPKNESNFFQTELNTIGFETGADALSWLLLMEMKAHDYPVYFPTHYCEETLDRIRLKVPNLKVNRYTSIGDISTDSAIIIWNHFNGYTPVPTEILNGKHIVLEDCVQSLEAIHRQVGKASFTSLRKWLELDLALVFGSYEHESRNVSRSQYYQTKKEAEELKRQWKTGSLINEKVFLDRFAEAENAMQTSEISFHQTQEITTYDWIKLLEQRRKNAQILIDFLVSKQIEMVEKSELFVMIRIEKRDEIRKQLAQDGVFAPVHWLDSTDKSLAKTLLSLPIDQRYNSEDMQRIISALENGFKVSGL